MVVAIWSQKALLMCPYVSFGKFPVLVPHCSRALLHNLQLTSDRCLIFASHLAIRMIPAIAIISRLLCLQGTRGSFKYFPKNALLSFCLNTKSAVHVPYSGWLILPCSALARTHDFKNFLSAIQVLLYAQRPFQTLRKLGFVLMNMLNSISGTRMMMRMMTFILSLTTLRTHVTQKRLKLGVWRMKRMHWSRKWICIFDMCCVFFYIQIFICSNV